MRKLLICIAVIVILVTSFALNATADQTKIPNYRTARQKIFWKDLYKNGGETLYCGESFNQKKSSFSIEHVYPASWMKRGGNCVGQSRKDCRKNSNRFNFMEADLHNLYPSQGDVNQDRGNYSFAILPGVVNTGCDVEIDKNKNLVEPTPVSRGNIARSMLYMAKEYNTSIEPPFTTNFNQRELMESWHCNDPVDDEERRRNDTIEQIQGTRNPYIDDPSLINCSAVKQFPND